MKKIPVYNSAEKESSDCETVKFVRAGKFVNRTVCNATGRLESAGLFRRLILTVCFPAAVFFSAPGASALPGFSPSVKDAPGEFVYYQDRTFERESYIGFLMYDEKTYSARYYAPSDKKAGKPELNVTIYFTVDPAENHIELTGEKIISSRTPEDSEIINYIHDMLYELSARRIKAGDIPDKVAVHDEFMQFGGSVTVFYDSCVPLFNIRRIESASGKIEFSVVTAGQLRSSEDKTFAEFKGFPKNSTKKKHLFKKARKTEAAEYTLSDGQKITLDSLWQQPMENVWLCQDAAVLSLGTIPPLSAPDKSAAENANSIPPLILRRLMQSSELTYSNWESAGITNTSDGCIIQSFFYQPETENHTVNIKKITARNDGGFYFLTLSVFQSVYEKNRSYFDGIIKSYKTPPVPGAGVGMLSAPSFPHE